jgi:uncharacterized protein (TIGR02594 family)
MLPKQYAWLGKEAGPRILVEFVKIYGTVETPGPRSNPVLLAWAERTGMAKVYRSDSIPWCGLGMGYVALQAGWEIPSNPLWARSWLTWGNPAKVPMLGDVLVFSRGKGGHVGVYVGEDATAFHVLGANQDDAVKVKRIAKSRLLGARRCPWRMSEPEQVRRIHLKATGGLSVNEA